MDELCRLCCSRKFVNNDIFDEENALYLKMSLYLPIKVFKHDRLPQKICNKCSCKVNDFYQFCNEAIEVQHRLHASLIEIENPEKLTNQADIKHNINSPPPCPPLIPAPSHAIQKGQEAPVQVKTEPVPRTPSPPRPVKEEYEMDFINNLIEPDHFDWDDVVSDDSDISLNTLKLKKKKTIKLKVKVPLELTNGNVKENKKDRKKKKKLKKLEDIVKCTLPEGTTITALVEKGGDADGIHNNPKVDIDIVKTEAMDEEKILQELGYMQRKADAVGADSEMAEWRCCVCFTRTCLRSEMLRHYKSHAAKVKKTIDSRPDSPLSVDGGLLKCRSCSKVFNERRDWQRHMWKHQQRPYSCGLCEKTFKDAAHILKHGQTHTFAEEGDTQPFSKRFICDLCPEVFVYMRYLREHRVMAHPEAQGRKLVNRCMHCSREFNHLNSLRRHLRSHTGERNHLCNVCGKVLTSSEHLKFHIRIHTGYKPNVCKTCGKGFVKKCNLTLHERVHSGEKPHVCSHCSKAFSQRSTLVIHERYHSGARPYVCSLCGRGFVAKGLLSMHLKTTCI